MGAADESLIFLSYLCLTLGRAPPFNTLYADEQQMDAKKYEVIKRFKLLGQKQTIEQSSLFDW